MAHARPGFFNVELAVDVSPIKRVAAALKRESNGVQLRKDLVVALRTAAQPAVQDVRAKLAAMPSSTARPSLGGYLSSRVRVQVRLTGSSAGVRVRIGQTPALRGFKMAAKRLNQKSWRRKVYGKAWVHQQSPAPGYFDDTLYARKREYYLAVLAALRKFARRVNERV